MKFSIILFKGTLFMDFNNRHYTQFYLLSVYLKIKN